MKKGLLSLCFFALVAGTMSFQSCNKIKDEIAKHIDPFNFSQQSFVVTIDPTSADSVNTGVVSTYINLQDSINKYLPSGVSLAVSSVSKVKLNKITVMPEEGFTSGQSGDNFRDISNVAAIFNTNVGLNKQLWPVGIWTEITDNSASEMQPLVFDYSKSDVNLKDYFNTSGTTEVKYYLSGKLRRPVSNQLKVRVSVEYTIVP